MKPAWPATAMARWRLFVRGGLSSWGSIGNVPWWALVGGLLGAVYVFVALEAVRTLGASGLTAVVITGQLTMSGNISGSAPMVFQGNGASGVTI